MLWTLGGANVNDSQREFRASIARAVGLPLVGISAALLVLYFWGPSTESFYAQGWAFTVVACLVALPWMLAAAVALPRSGFPLSDLLAAIAVGLLALVPGWFFFAFLALVLQPLPVLPGLIVASFLFPRGKRRWIPLVWLAAVAVFVASLYVSSSMISPSANAAEGVGMTGFRSLVWVLILLESVIVSPLVERVLRKPSSTLSTVQVDAAAD